MRITDSLSHCQYKDGMTSFLVRWHFFLGFVFEFGEEGRGRVWKRCALKEKKKRDEVEITCNFRMEFWDVYFFFYDTIFFFISINSKIVF